MSSTGLCQFSQCRRVSNVQCLCCQTNFCFHHLKKHCDRPLDRANHLVDEINILGERIRTFNRENFLGQAKDKLDDWKDKAIGLIERFYQEKCQELDEIVDEKIRRQEQQWTEIKQIMDQIFEDQASTDDQISQIEKNLRALDDKLTKTEQLTVEIEEPTVNIERKKIRIAEKISLQTICSSATGRTIQCSQIKSPILASNDECFLVHQNDHLCCYDDHGYLMDKLPWKFGKVWDACWLTKLSRFIVLSENCEICFVHDKTISVADALSFGIDRHYSCTSSPDSLYTSTYGTPSKILEFSLEPIPKFIRQWKSPEICARDETISNIRYHDYKIAMIVQKPTEKILSVELRSVSSFQRLWSINFGLDSRPYVFGLSPFQAGHWLFICPNSSRLIQITQDGYVKETHSYRSRMFNAVLFGRDRLAVLTEKTVDLHPISEHVEFF